VSGFGLFNYFTQDTIGYQIVNQVYTVSSAIFLLMAWKISNKHIKHLYLH